MRARVQLTGLGESGPVWIWCDAVTSVYRVESVQYTLISVAGCRDPHAVEESAEQVLAALDAAERPSLPPPGGGGFTMAGGGGVPGGGRSSNYYGGPSQWDR